MVRLDEDAFRDDEPEALNSGINGFGTLLGQVVTGQHSEDAAIEKVIHPGLGHGTYAVERM